MAPEQETQASNEQSSTVASPRPPGRRRSGRGRRGHRGRRSHRATESTPPPPPDEHPAEAPQEDLAPESSAAVSAEAPPPFVAELAKGNSSAVHEAIEDVTGIIDSLRKILEQMEEVLETLEVAERQKDADEQEIEVLRRNLRQLQRSR